MTLVELCETSGNISLLRVSVRDESGTLIHVYRIGPRATSYQYDVGAKHPIDIIKKPVHVQDDGARSFEIGFISKNVPKSIRNLEVNHWSCNSEFGCKITDAKELWAEVYRPKDAPLETFREEPQVDEYEQITF